MPENLPTDLRRVGPRSVLPILWDAPKLDVEPVLTAPDLSLGDVAGRENIPFSTALQLLDRSSHVAHRPHLGLLLGAGQDDRAHGIVGDLMRNAQTLGQALLDLASWQFVNSRGAAVYLHRVGETFVLGFCIYGRTCEWRIQAYDLVLAAGCNLIRSLTHGRVAPLEVLVSHRPPLDPQHFQSVLGSPVRFNQDQSCLLLSREMLGTRIPGADRNVRMRVLEQLRGLRPDQVADMPARLRRMLRPQLLAGNGSLPAIGRALGIHPRTLCRHLAKAGLSFESLRDEVRDESSRELLEMTDLPIGEIATALGFASHSAFIHFFKRMHGTTPTHWRQHAGSGPL
jgi:AraC-like DNA-binding protein